MNPMMTTRYLCWVKGNVMKTISRGRRPILYQRQCCTLSRCQALIASDSHTPLCTLYGIVSPTLLCKLPTAVVSLGETYSTFQGDLSTKIRCIPDDDMYTIDTRSPGYHLNSRAPPSLPAPYGSSMLLTPPSSSNPSSSSFLSC